MTEPVVRSVRELDLAAVAAGPKTPSPTAWEDQVLYFLLCDRFSDGREQGTDAAAETGALPRTPLFGPGDDGNAVTGPDQGQVWRQAGLSWVGGTLAGIISKLDYLVGLGVTALWISPVLQQARTPAGQITNYHGYATQNFLQVEPRLGTAEQLRELVVRAHEAGLRVILDIVLNHTGDVFAYRNDRPWDGTEREVAGWRAADGTLVPFTEQAAAGLWPHGAVFPTELHPPETFTRKGRIVDWDRSPEYLEGDFAALKDVAHGTGPIDDFRPSPALRALTRAYCWWIAYADLDGFRIDTVKHLQPGATRYFVSAVHEFAQTLGKDRFLCLGEITGPREYAIDLADRTGLDAALGLADVAHHLEATAKGRSDPEGYFRLFRNSELIGKDSHAWLRNTVVTAYDDHDQVRQGGSKARFCADADGKKLALVVMALNVLTLGIPCVYYGSEQALDGSGGGPDADRYLREAMFGGEFGAFRSRDRHVFDPGHRLYRGLSGLLAVRRAEPALRRGRQYLRPISGDGVGFGLPTGFGGRLRSLVAWSRILADREILVVVNVDPDAEQTAWVTVDADLQAPDGALRCLFRSGSVGPPSAEPAVPVVDRNGRAVRISLPAAGVAIYAR